MNKIRKPLLYVFLLVVLFASVYFIYPKEVLELGNVLEIKNENNGEWYTLMDVPACKGDKYGPWCYVECYDKTNFKYYLCKGVTTRYRKEVSEYGEVVVACPSMENTNLLGNVCEPISIK